MANTWKIIAIITMILFILETSCFVWAVWYGTKEIEKDNLCYWDICNEYPDAIREGNVCFCYDYDLLGDLHVVETEIMK